MEGLDDKRVESTNPDDLNAVAQLSSEYSKQAIWQFFTTRLSEGRSGVTAKQYEILILTRLPLSGAGQRS